MDSSLQIEVSTRDELLDAVKAGNQRIRIWGRIGNLPSITLTPGQRLSADDPEASLLFNDRGITLTADNAVEGLRLVCKPGKQAVRIGRHNGDRGILELSALVCCGQISLVFGDETVAANLHLRSIGIADADSTKLRYGALSGLDFLPGAITIWNRSTRANVISVDATGLDVGSLAHPTRGSGLLISGTVGAGKVVAGAIRVGTIHVRSASFDEDARQGGAFIIGCNVSARSVEVDGPIVSEGDRAPAMQNSGDVSQWRLKGTAYAHGAFSAGLSNSGRIFCLDGDGVIETGGVSSAGCHLEGSTGMLRLKSVRTIAAGSPGVDIHGHVDVLEILESISTVGDPAALENMGDVTRVPSDGLRIRPHATLRCLIARKVRSTGLDALPLRNEGSFG